MQYKRYNSFLLGGALCVLLTIAVFNYWMDPGNIFGNPVLVETCGKWLLDGHDVAITQNYDERLLQKYLIEHDDRSYDILVFGSSRTMAIGSSLFPNSSVKNYSVSSASIEDDIALYFLYERLHGKIKKIIIGADAWLLNKNSRQIGWKSIAKEYDFGKGILEGNEKRGNSESINLEKYAQLLSLPYLKESIKSVKKGWANTNQGYYLADERMTIASNAGIICPDGMHIPSMDAYTKNADLLVRKFIAGDIGSMYPLENYEVLDVSLQSQCRKFISYLRSQEIEVVVYLTPYHPNVYSYLTQNGKYRNVVATEEFFRTIASEYGLKVVGSYDPGKCGLSNADFFDEMHVRPESVERILQGKL